MRSKVGISDIVSAVDHLTKDIAIAGEVTVYTDSFPLDYNEYFSLFYKATSTSSTPNLKLELQVSWDKPDTEGSADDDWVEPEDMSDIESALITETQHVKKLSPPVAKYGRIKITGNSGNPSDTTVRLRLGTN